MRLPNKIAVIILNFINITIVYGQEIYNFSDVACGRISLEITSRIIGGRNAHISEVPWTAQIKVGQQHYCGGAFIARHWILSAAHCLYLTGRLLPLHRLSGYGGKTSRDDNDMHTQRFEFINAYIHPGYIRPSHQNDISLFQTRQPAVWTEYLQPLCLFKYPHEALVGLQTTIAGWGSTGEFFWQLNRPIRKNSKTLKIAHVPIQSRETCEFYLGFNYDESNMICTGYLTGEADSCEGDSGGPVVIHKRGVYGAIGIITWGIGCGLPDSPGINTKVEVFLDWIASTIFGVFL